ncbi:MAG: hypothetical protein KGS60_19585 [Verrucomicrobia bacterium]|nr:hypothetical protein [Verrucomicrobiota bacterium]
MLVLAVTTLVTAARIVGGMLMPVSVPGVDVVFFEAGNACHDPPDVINDRTLALALAGAQGGGDGEEKRTGETTNSLSIVR